MVPHHGPGFRHQARPVLLLPDHQQLAGVADDRARRAGRACREQRPRDAAGGHAGGRQGLLVEAVGPELDRADGGEGGGVDLREGGGGEGERIRGEGGPFQVPGGRRRREGRERLFLSCSFSCSCSCSCSFSFSPIIVPRSPCRAPEGSTGSGVPPVVVVVVVVRGRTERGQQGGGGKKTKLPPCPLFCSSSSLLSILCSLPSGAPAARS